MSNLTDLVPPLEQCKLIPAGEFKDSALVWRVPNSSFPEEDEFYEVHERDKCEAWMKDKQIPAPTLEEIITAIGQYEIFGFGERFSIMQGDVCVLKQKSKTTAALKLWLKLKEIEHEQ